MRRLILPALAALLVLPAGAAKRVTVEQLEQALAADSAAHRDDAEAARQLGELELSERLTGATLARFNARRSLGPKAGLALEMLADQSAFLDPPVSELPATAVPDAATQQRMMDAARGYVIQTVPHLIDFFATRNTIRFDDSPQVLVKGDWPVRAGLHLAGSSSQEVTFRDGKESRQAVRQSNSKSASVPQEQQEKGLNSWGEFGPALAVVLTDAAKGKTSWSHWEETPAGLAAVFRYSVPRSASHYAVSYCCVPGAPSSVPLPTIGGLGRGAARSQTSVEPEGAGTHAFSETPGYHGSLAVDPATGAILRVTIEAEMKVGSPLTRAATAVEYGRIQIGDRSFVCPVRSVAVSIEEPRGRLVPGTSVGDWGNSSANPIGAPALLLNETRFSNYHRMAATARVVPSEMPSGLEAPEPQEPGAAASIDITPASTTPDLQQAAAANADALPTSRPEAAPAEPVVPEISLTEASGLPDEPPVSLQQDASVTLKHTTRLVDVGIVAYDKKGQPVKDLKQDDFEIYDNGRKQEVRFFSQIGRDAQAAAAAPNPAESVFSNRTADAAAGVLATSASEAGATILLIDESHIAWSDLSNARAQMLRFLGGLPAGERVGFYTMTGLGFRVLTEITTDHQALIARLQKWMPSAQSVAQAQEEEARNRQHINEVHNVSDLSSVNGNSIDAPVSNSPVDYQLRDRGQNPARDSLIVLVGVARHLSAVAGHKNLVWVSSDNVFADWTNQAVGVEKGSKYIDSFAMGAQEAMNDAHAAVFPFDVSQLEGGAISADMQHRNVELTQAAADNATMGAGGSRSQGGTPSEHNLTPGRAIAQMQQDIHPIQQPIVEVAEATGGKTIRRSGDLAAALAGIVEDGHAKNQLSFSPQGPADDKYHIITVKLEGRRGVNLRYRTGYLFQKEPSTLKDRFNQAVWRPAEMDEVAVSATVDAQSPGATLKIKIAASDLGLQQQDGRWTDKLDIFFIQRDDAGLHAQVEGQTLGLRLKSSTYQSLLSGGVPFDHFVQLRPGMASLRVLVVDENSGRMGSVTVPAAALGAGQ